MAFKSRISPLHLARILICSFLLCAAPLSMGYGFPFFPMRFGFQKKVQTQEAESSLVRVSIVTRFQGAKDTVEINGRVVKDYSPTIIQSFTSTGIVLDHKGHIMTFLGVRWLDVQSDSSIEISADGQKWKGKLVGIDQRNGVAVVKLANSKLKKTLVCQECELKDGATVMASVSAPKPRLQQAQVVSVGMGPEVPGPGAWVMTVDRPLPDIWQPVLTSDHRVLGFIASQDPMGIRNIVYPISLLLASAEKIVKQGGDIFAGWLGMFFVDSISSIGPGVYIQGIEPGSPAQNAGLAAGDFLLKYNGERVGDSGKLIQLVEESPIGSKASIEIVRDGNPLTINALVEARQTGKNRGKLSLNLPGAFGYPAAEQALLDQRLLFGVHTNLLDPPLAEFLQMPVKNGLLVSAVVKNSPAEKAGILIGDVIISIDGHPVTDAPSFTAFWQTHDWSDKAIIQVNRKGAEHTIPVQLPNPGK